MCTIVIQPYLTVLLLVPFPLLERTMENGQESKAQLKLELEILNMDYL